MKQKATLLIVYATFIYFSCEIVSLIAYPILFKESFSFSKIASSQNKVSSVSSMEYSLAQFGNKMMTIHPYQGFVYNKDQLFSTDGIPVSEYGFLDIQAPVFEKKEDKIVIGVFGGSVAWWFSHKGSEKLKSELSKLPQFKNKEITVLKLAIGAYKQPQQLITLSYLLSIGAKFDYIINIDGFNEITLPILENTNLKINPIFPMYWSQLNTSVIDVEQQKLIGSMVFLRESRASLAKVFSKLRFNISASVLWSIIDRLVSNKINLLTTIKDSKNETFSTQGPSHNKLPVNDELHNYGEVWVRSSLAMSKLAEYSGAKYLHFLQPNQYVQDSKPIAEEERNFFNNKTYKDLVEVGYPILIKDGQNIKNQGIKYYDLTSIFKTTKEPVYADDCCHLNVLGNELLAVGIAKAIEENN